MLRSLSPASILLDSSFIFAIGRSLQEFASADFFNDAPAKPLPQKVNGADMKRYWPTGALSTTNSANACQCLGCGRSPWRILLAYHLDTPIDDRVADIGTLASMAEFFVKIIP